MGQSGRSVLIVDNDEDVAEVARAILSDEGYEVTVVAEVSADAIAAAVGRLEPDVLLLDGQSQNDGYGTSWLEAATLASRARRIPVVMFSAHGSDVQEARDGSSARSKAASFAGIVAKPFEIDDLIAIIAEAAGTSVSFDRSPAADESRTRALAQDLERLGASEVRPSTRREWVTFRTPEGRVMQVYWWQTGGAYLIGRYDEDGRLETIGRSYDRDAVVAICGAAMSVADAQQAAG